MPVSRYCILVGKVSAVILPGPNSSVPHAQILVDVGGRPMSAEINIAPRPGDSELLFWNNKIDDKLELVQELKDIPPGLRTYDECRFTPLDYIRGGLLELNDAVIVSPEDHVLSDFLSQAGTQLTSEGLIAYIYGSVAGETVQNVHMNQGNHDHFAKEDGIFQDGGVLLQFPDGHWQAIFIAFSSQALETDNLGRARGPTLRAAYSAIPEPAINMGRDKIPLSPEGNASHPIYQKAKSCRALFKRCLVSKILSGGDFLTVTYGRFNWWSVGISAEEQGRSSLDHRIRSRPDICSTLVRFLEILAASLDACIHLGMYTSHLTRPYVSQWRLTYPKLPRPIWAVSQRTSAS